MKYSKQLIVITTKILIVIIVVILGVLLLSRMIADHIEEAKYGEFELSNGYVVVKIHRNYKTIADPDTNFIGIDDIDLIAWDDQYVFYRKSRISDPRYGVLNTETGDVEKFSSLDAAQEYLRGTSAADLVLSSVRDYFPETRAGAPHSIDNNNGS